MKYSYSEFSNSKKQLTTNDMQPGQIFRLTESPEDLYVKTVAGITNFRTGSTFTFVCNVSEVLEPGQSVTITAE